MYLYVYLGCEAARAARTLGCADQIKYLFRHETDHTGRGTNTTTLEKPGPFRDLEGQKPAETLGNAGRCRARCRQALASHGLSHACGLSGDPAW